MLLDGIMAIDPVQAGSIILTLVLLEAVLSFDNAAILAVMSRKLPLGEGRRRALNYGLLIAYVLRVIAILAAVVLVKYSWFLTVGGLYLVFLFAKHFFDMARGKEEHTHHVKTSAPKRLFGMSALTIVVIQIGLVDLAFALDQVVAAVAFTKDVPHVKMWVFTYQQLLILSAATAGLISLRVLAPFISRLMDWLPSLEHMALVAVGFVGALLVLEHPIVVPAPEEFIHLLKPFKIPITLGLFGIPVLIKLLFKWPKSATVHHATLEESMREASQGTPSVGALHHATQEHDNVQVKRDDRP
ncbi:MAG: TerC family protein [Thermoplasmatota archaeon]